MSFPGLQRSTWRRIDSMSSLFRTAAVDIPAVGSWCRHWRKIGSCGSSSSVAQALADNRLVTS